MRNSPLALKVLSASTEVGGMVDTQLASSSIAVVLVLAGRGHEESDLFSPRVCFRAGLG